MIIAVNFVIRTVNIILIKYIGYHTESHEAKTIMASIFIAQFFNTAILLLLGNANFKYSVLFWVPSFDNGIYSDLN